MVAIELNRDKLFRLGATLATFARRSINIAELVSAIVARIEFLAYLPQRHRP
jgi:hypothetical protein